MSTQAERPGAVRKRWRWLRSGVALGLVACLLAACKCEDKAAEKPDAGFCDKQSEWDLWEVEVQKFGWDDGMMELHALRLGICSMIYTGQIEPERGIRLFEKAHFAWMERIVSLQLQGANHQQAKPPTE